MNNINDIIYFELNNWRMKQNYPSEEPFISWVEKEIFCNNDWCEKNQLCVKIGIIDMSINWCITAAKDWVLKNCPALLNNSNKKFIFEDGIGSWGWKFLPYCEENFGTFLCDDYGIILQKMDDWEKF